MRLIPAPRGTGIVSAPVPKKLLHMAGIDDCYTSATGQTATLGNFGNIYFMIKVFSLVIYMYVSFSAMATYEAIANTYSYLTPDLWKETVFVKSPYQEHTDFLSRFSGERKAVAEARAN